MKKATLLLLIITFFSSGYSQNLNDSLKAHFKFDGDVLDATINNEDLKTPTNPDYRVVNGTDSAYYFDGSTRLESDSVFDNSSYTEMSISLWFNVPSKKTFNQTLIQGAYLGFGIIIDANTGKLAAVFPSPTSQALRSPNDVADSTWHHVVAQNDGDTTFIYIDSQLVGKKAEAFSPGNGGSNNKLYFGEPVINTAPEGLTGMVNNVRIYSRTLKDSEIDSIYQLEKPKKFVFCDSTGLIDSSSLQMNLKAHFKFDGNVLDATDNNEDLKNPVSPDYRVYRGSDSTYYFNGNDRLESNSSFDNSSYKKAAISFWFNTISNHNRQTIIQGANMGFGVYFDGSLGRIKVFFDPPSSLALESNSGLNDSLWHHVVAQNDGDTTYMYVDAVFIGSKYNPLAPGNGSSNNKLYFGKTNQNVDPYTGSLNDVRIYDRMLEECEIDSLYQQKRPDTSTITSIANYDNSDRTNEFLIYPNPTNGNINIAIENTELYDNIRIMNLVGQTVFSQEIIHTGVTHLEITGPKGIYLVEIIDIKGNRYTSKVIKN